MGLSIGRAFAGPSTSTVVGTSHRPVLLKRILFKVQACHVSTSKVQVTEKFPTRSQVGNSSISISLHLFPTAAESRQAGLPMKRSVE
jgi:hypothetical protein